MLLKAHNPKYKFHIRDKSEDDFNVVREIWCENVYEVVEGDFKFSGVVVDIGANIGTFSIYAAHFDDGSKDSVPIKVYAVEPEPHNLKLLKKNIKENNVKNRIEVVEVAVSDYNGVATISNEEGGSTIKLTTEEDVSEVEVTTLKRLWKDLELEHVDVLKIDVEGSETEIILAAPTEVLASCRYITMEVDNRSGNKLGRLVEKLSETHQMKVVGSHERGGMIFARRY